MVFSWEGGVMIRISGVSLVRHMHGHVVQRHGCSHVGIVFSGGGPWEVVGIHLECISCWGILKEE